jgi:hypothetical protein
MSFINVDMLQKRIKIIKSITYLVFCFVLVHADILYPNLYGENNFRRAVP